MDGVFRGCQGLLEAKPFEEERDESPFVERSKELYGKKAGDK